MYLYFGHITNRSLVGNRKHVHVSRPCPPDQILQLASRLQQAVFRMNVQVYKVRIRLLPHDGDLYITEMSVPSWRVRANVV